MTATSYQLLAPADYRRMPWKDGGGHTAEIATHPAGAGLTEFVWRVSVADVTQDGPFSRFPGVDRTLVLLSGDGMHFSGSGSPMELHARFEPITFAGEAAIDCALTRGPTRDFNLMVRRDAASGEVVVVRDSGVALAPAHAYVCYGAEGASECLVAGHAPIALAQDHAVVVLGVGTAVTPGLHVSPCSPGAVALVVVIGPPPQAGSQ